MTAPNRRWPRFSLRTMFVVVTVAAALTHWLNGARKQAWEREHLDGRYHVIEYSTAHPSQASKLSLGLRLFGATPHECIYVDQYAVTEADERRLHILFPECEVVRTYDGPENRLDPPGPFHVVP